MYQTEKEKLIERAFRLKRAWLLGVAMAGENQFESFGIRERIVPSYSKQSRKFLESHVVELSADFRDVLDLLLVKGSYEVGIASRWMASKYDEWVKAGCGVYSLCTVEAFERKIGELRHRDYMEVPPYAEMLLQGWHEMAIRHPEYMLARDLSLLYNLYLDAGEALSKINFSNPPAWAGFASENLQSLARSTILTCFNLLESFVNGLAHGYLILHPQLNPQTKKKLSDTQSSLKSRIVGVPALIAGTPGGLDINKPPISELFGPIKHRRDSFVHCEPGDQKTHQGYIKELYFHDVPPKIVRSAVELTLEVIRHQWRFLHNKDGPKWLPIIESDGRFPARNMRIVPHDIIDKHI